MSKVLTAVFLIFGTVVGSGFSSGKEILVFFGRFGILSYFYIFLACVSFFFVFRFFLLNGEKINATIEKSKTLHFFVFIVSVVFCASMFAGICNLFSYFGKLQIFATFILLCICFYVTARGLSSLEKINLFLMPLCAVIFFCVLVFCLRFSSTFSIFTNSAAGFLYAPLYVALNTCMSGIVISKLSLSKKQANVCCLLCCLLIFSFLTLGNFVLQKNGEVFFEEMPFLALASKNSLMFTLAFFVILVGCFTTLVSLCFNIKNSLAGKFSNGFFSTFFAVFLPFSLSALGFSQIVSFLYPICSVLGVFVLIILFFPVAKEK